MPREDYERKRKRGWLRRCWQKILLLIARFTILTRWRAQLYRAAGVRLGPRVYVGLDCVIDSEFPELITAGEGAGLAIRTTFVAHSVTYEQDASGGPPRRIEYVAPIVIGARTWTGAGSTVMPGVTIGEDTITGAGSVAVNDIPPRVIAVGNPARVIKQRTSLGEE
jgi:acetyltransferase-like isoleucine patch superfamily enzyme